jgi:hypothetical protein
LSRRTDRYVVGRDRFGDSFKLIAVGPNGDGDRKTTGHILARGPICDIITSELKKNSRVGPAGTWYLHDGHAIYARIVSGLDRRQNVRSEIIGATTGGDVVEQRVYSAARPLAAQSNDSPRRKKRSRRRKSST